METVKGWRAGVENGILPEMVKYCAGLMDYILDLFKEVWNDDRVPEE